MLCRSIAEKGFDTIAGLINGAQMAEIRIEKSDLSKDEVYKLFALHENLIATCRAENLSDKERLELLKSAISGGARWVDIEIESEEAYRTELLAYAKNKGCSVIISYHNYDKTPKNSKLGSIVIESIKNGADLVKIATSVSNIKDNARLMALYQYDVTLLAIGMGELGIITRISAIALGAPFTFVRCDEMQETASGQLSESQMNKLLKYL
ncbi:MAG: type I 3-dehydroquinate dehydratase [Salinivirgaceae bacterium]|nr:type I 3-dehydroquinate dehydratase [Salinivirgaceae bacterium]